MKSLNHEIKRAKNNKKLLKLYFFKTRIDADENEKNNSNIKYQSAKPSSKTKTINSIRQLADQN